MSSKYHESKYSSNRLTVRSRLRSCAWFELSGSRLMKPMIWMVFVSVSRLSWQWSLRVLVLNTTVLFWGMIEANLGLLAACLPTLRGLLKLRTVDSLIQSYRSRSWLRSSERSNKSTGELDGLPLTNSTFQEGKGRSFESKTKYPHDITLTTTHSVGAE